MLKLVKVKLIFKENVMKLSQDLGMLLLAIWLILKGLMPLMHLSFQGSGTVLDVLAIAAGVLILFDR